MPQMSISLVIVEDLAEVREGLKQFISLNPEFTILGTFQTAEEALQKANEQFVLAEKASNGFVYDWNIETGRYVRSEGFNAVLGYEPGEVKENADGWIRLIHPDDLALIEIATPGTMGEKNNFSVEYRVRCADGEYLHMLDISKGLLK